MFFLNRIFNRGRVPEITTTANSLGDEMSGSTNSTNLPDSSESHHCILNDTSKVNTVKRNIISEHQEQSTKIGHNQNTPNKRHLKQHFEISGDKPFIINSLFYILIMTCVGFPMWFYTCSVTRYPLPNLSHLEYKMVHALDAPPRLHLDISLVQFTSDQQFSNYLRQNVPSKLETNCPNVTYDVDWRVRRPTDLEADLFQLHTRKHFASNFSNLAEELQNLEQSLLELHKSSNRFRQFIFLIEEPNYSAFCDPSRAHTYSISFERFIYVCPSTALNRVDNYVSTLNLINSALNEVYTDTVDATRLKSVMNSKMDLVISLLPELDRINIYHLSKLEDSIHGLYAKNVKNKFPELNELIDISTITQYLYDILDEKLLRDIIVNNRVSDFNTTSPETSFRVIKSGQMNLLFHKFEARITERTTPGVHNVLFVIPDPEKPNLLLEGNSPGSINILEARETSTMMISSDDKSLVLKFRALIRRLVGFTSPNICDNCLVRRDVFFNRWEMDAIMGALTISKLQAVVHSLRSISLQVVGVKIPKDVSVMVANAHRLALDAIIKLEQKDTLEAYRLASDSYRLSELAFFDPSLLESLYFPDESKYAIYLPLFLPLTPPIMTSIWRLLRTLFINLKFHNSNDKVKIN